LLSLLLDNLNKRRVHNNATGKSKLLNYVKSSYNDNYSKSKVPPPPPGNPKNTTPDSTVSNVTAEAVMLQQQDEIEDLKTQMNLLLSKIAKGEIFSPSPKKSYHWIR
jgi:hypothetical protein